MAHDELQEQLDAFNETVQSLKSQLSGSDSSMLNQRNGNRPYRPQRFACEVHW